MSPFGLNGILAQFNPLAPIASEPLFTFSLWRWSVTVSNHMFMIALAAAVLIIAVPMAVRRRKGVPGGFHSLIEAVCVFLRDEVARPILGSHADRYIGFIWTVFFFILTLNLLAMVPTEKFVTLVTGKKSHWGGAATANIWVTGAMAAVSFFMIHISGIREQGLRNYIVHFIPPVPWWMMPFIYFLELISAFVRPFALAIRLFANILAGHILLATIMGLIVLFKSFSVACVSLAVVVAMSFMELFVAFLQAYIFTFLTVLFISFSVAPEH